MKKMQTEDNNNIKSNGIDQLIDLLPPLPRRWTKPNLTLERNATSLPITMQLKANPELIHPGSFQRNGKAAKKTISMYSTGSLEKNTLEAMKEQKEDQNQVRSNDVFRWVFRIFRWVFKIADLVGFVKTEDQKNENSKTGGFREFWQACKTLSCRF